MFTISKSQATGFFNALSQMPNKVIATHIPVKLVLQNFITLKGDYQPWEQDDNRHYIEESVDYGPNNAFTIPASFLGLEKAAVMLGINIMTLGRQADYRGHFLPDEATFYEAGDNRIISGLGRDKETPEAWKLLIEILAPVKAGRMARKVMQALRP